MTALQTLTLPVLPLGTGVLLPEMFVTVALETTEASAAADAAGDDGQILVVPRVGSAYAPIGTVAKIEDRGDLPNGTRAIIVRGLYRAAIGVGVPGSGTALWVQATRAEETNTDTERAHELAREYKVAVSTILESRGMGGLIAAVRGTVEPSAVADLAGYSPDLSVDQKIQVLEELDIEARLALVVEWAKEILAEQSVRDSIRRDVSEGMEKTQREFLLRQQLAAIRKELGEDGSAEGELDRFEALVDDELVPEQVRKAVEREIGRLERTSEQSPEHGWIRTWLDTIADLPWAAKADDNLDVAQACRVLDADHNGLEDVKDRIVEHLAIRKRRNDRGCRSCLCRRAGRRRAAGAIITLVGPPGVGKTSLGESVARADGSSVRARRPRRRAR